MTSDTLKNKAKLFALYIGQKIEYPKIDKGYYKETLTGVSRTDGLETTYQKKRNGISGDYLAFSYNGNHNCNAIEAKLLLKPLSSITDEDSIDIWHLFNPDGGNFTELTKDQVIKQGKELAQFLNFTNGKYLTALFQVINVYQYLQLKGYALPWNGITVDEQIESGWVKLIKS